MLAEQGIPFEHKAMLLNSCSNTGSNAASHLEAAVMSRLTYPIGSGQASRDG